MEKDLGKNQTCCIELGDHLYKLGLRNHKWQN